MAYDKEELNIDFFDFDFDLEIEPETDKRIHEPQRIQPYKNCFIKYQNAEQLADKINLSFNESLFCFIPGNFIFGDFIEALLVRKNSHIKKMTISTLSLSENNIYSLQNLLNGGYIDELNLIVSDYFYGHERHKLIPIIYDCLDKENKFQLAVARIHAKICIFETYNGGLFTIHGSANLRSSDNIEQFSIQENKSLYLHINEFYNSIITKYKTINKSLKTNDIWQADDKEDQEEEKQKEEAHNSNQVKLV